MTALLILTFDGIGATEYDAVNFKLGIDMTTGQGEWPAGLLSHSGGTADDGSFVVAEVWDDRDSQARFMADRLGEALAAGGAPPPRSVTWVDVLGYQTP